MWSQIMSFFIQFTNDGMKVRVPVKITGEEKGSLDIGIVQVFFNLLPALSKLMTGKDKSDFLLRAISSDDRSFVGTVASCIGGYCFFGRPAASCAASK